MTKFKGTVAGMADGNLKNKLDPFSIAQIGVDVLGPLAYELAVSPERRRARERSQVDLTVPELLSGTVRDMPRPNFALPSRPARGSSLAEANMAQLFRDAFQRQQEGGFEVQNAASKIAQEQQITDRANRNTLAQTNVMNQEELANSNMAFRELLMGLADRTSSIESLFANVSKDIGQAGYLSNIKKLGAAQHVIMNPDIYKDAGGKGVNSNTYKAALALINAGLGLRKGGKLKTKFSR